jgi:hypothetical protein
LRRKKKLRVRIAVALLVFLVRAVSIVKAAAKPPHSEKFAGAGEVILRDIDGRKTGFGFCGEAGVSDAEL